jgi:hypothetical protein
MVNNLFLAYNNLESHIPQCTIRSIARTGHHPAADNLLKEWE